MVNNPKLLAKNILGAGCDYLVEWDSLGVVV